MTAKTAFNPYEVLGLERGCTDKDVQKAYKQQCLRWHPDKNLENKEEAEKRFIAAKEAFLFLFDKSKREEFDRDYEKAKYREATYKARMEKADSARRKFIDELQQREKEFSERSRTSETLSPAQAYQKKKDEEKRIRSEFEVLRRKLEEEAADELHAQQARLARLVQKQEEKKKKQEAEDKHPTLQINWKPSTGRDYDEGALRKIYGAYGTISTITPIRITKKGGRSCMIEFDCGLSEFGAEIVKGYDGPEIVGKWVIPPQQSNEDDEKTSAEEKRSDYSSMSYEELQAKLFADMELPPEKKKKWHEEEH